MVEHSSHLGERYIARTPAEYARIVRAGLGAGALTSGTVICKVLLGILHSNPLTAMLTCCANYAAGFLAMQGLGLRLATKQPSLSAATLAWRIEVASLARRRRASLLSDADASSDLHEFAHEVSRIARSQFAAAFGNVAAVIPAAFFFAWLYEGITHHPFIDAAHSAAILDSLHPFHGLCLPYAALTGVLLWLASLAPAALQMAGAPRLSRIGNSLALAFLLAVVPAIGARFHLPLDVRHMTLSTGALTLAACSLGLPGALQNGVLGAMLGIGFIAALNFGVSFALSLAFAIHARGIDTRWLLRLTRSVRCRWRNAPWEFFFPPAAVRLLPATCACATGAQSIP